MSFEIYGINPRSTAGEQYRGGCWHEVLVFCREIAPHLDGQLKLAHYNDGKGLNSEDSVYLSAILLKAIEDGTFSNYRSNVEADAATRMTATQKLAGMTPVFVLKEYQLRSFAVFLSESGGFGAW